MAGPSIFLNQHVGLQGALFYERYGGDAFTNSGYNAVGVWGELQIHLDCDRMAKNSKTNTTTGLWTPDIYKGDWLLGADLSYEHSKFTDTKTTRNNDFSIGTDLGYGFKDRLFGGVRLGYLSSDNPQSTKAFTEFTGAPFLRYYFLPAAQHTNIFGDVSYGLGSEGTATKKSFNYFGVMVGPACFLNRHTSVEAAVTYKTYGGDAYPNRESSIGVWAGFQIHLDGMEKKK